MCINAIYQCFDANNIQDAHLLSVASITNLAIADCFPKFLESALSEPHLCDNCYNNINFSWVIYSREEGTLGYPGSYAPTWSRARPQHQEL